MNRFDDSQINLPILRERAFHLRWAVQDEDVIPLTAAEPDFPAPAEIQQALCDYIQAGYLSYGPAEGLPSFREGVAKMLRERRAIAASADEVLATDSAASAMFVVAKHLLQAGDEAIIFDPVDFLFRQSVENAGASVRLAQVDAESGEFDLAQLASLITPKTRMLCICNPHNPLGRVLREAELRQLGEFAIEHDLHIMSDEIWSDIVYDGRPYHSIASLDPRFSARTYTVYGFSKSFGIAGLRIGFIHAPSSEDCAALVLSSKANTTAYGVATLSQVGAEAAMAHCWYWVDEFRAHLTTLRDRAVARFNAMPGVQCRAPEGTFVLFPRVPGWSGSMQSLCDDLLSEARVAVVPGEAQWFGPGAQGHIRLAYATSEKRLDEALDRIETFLRKAI